MAQQARTTDGDEATATEALATEPSETELSEAGPSETSAEKPADATPADETAELREQLEEAQAQAAAERDRALRAVAEAENIRKRADRSIESAHKFALERFVGDLLPAIDSFERAVEAADAAESGNDSAQAIAEGITLSLKLLGEALEKQGIAVVDPIGAPFDPNLHEAMSMIDSATAEPGTVIEVFQKGYTVNGRLARPARVIVARQAASTEDTEDAAQGSTDGSEGSKEESNSQDGA